MNDDNLTVAIRDYLKKIAGHSVFSCSVMNDYCHPRPETAELLQRAMEEIHDLRTRIINAKEWLQ